MRNAARWDWNRSVNAAVFASHLDLLKPAQKRPRRAGLSCSALDRSPAIGRIAYIGKTWAKVLAGNCTCYRALSADLLANCLQAAHNWNKVLVLYYRSETERLLSFSVNARDLERARGGDPDAINNLLRTCWPQAYRIALGVLGDRGLAEDAAQEASALIALHIMELQETKAFTAWFYRVVTRSAISIARLRKSNFPLQKAMRVAYTSDFDAPDILDAVNRLPINQRVPVILKYYTGLNSNEIGTVLKISAALVRFRLMLARRTLRITLLEPAACKGSLPDV